MKMSANSGCINDLNASDRGGAHVLAPDSNLVSLQICGCVYFGARDDLINQTVKIPEKQAEAE